ncbi:cell division protein FtsQ/DivIB [Bifidobacterium choloepi]|uniref:FtsQ-type POTRA domain-containing protein n=1 Tax=Bifidobacterium choloepi TaxID=2614131 RepID=A0A6I5NMV0_9BIFI|nr:FtsQ-type POTRA domain-containing protein [Bifidobacterium choloepi]NEG70052.1 FtsQ-type POTRA domain-containing protein [Bifidobacterium choloepi]
MAGRTVSSGHGSGKNSDHGSAGNAGKQRRSARSAQSSGRNDSHVADNAAASARTPRSSTSAARRSPATGQFAATGRAGASGVRRIRNNTSRQTAAQAHRRTAAGNPAAGKSSGTSLSRGVAGKTPARTSAGRVGASGGTAPGKSPNTSLGTSGVAKAGIAKSGAAKNSAATSTKKKRRSGGLFGLVRRGRGAEAATQRRPRTAGSRFAAPAGESSSKPGGFVDARRLSSEDVVAKTLSETSGGIGLATRPKVIDFKARQKERKRAATRVIAIRAGIAAAVVAVVVALVWLLFFSPVLRLDAGNITVEGANEWVGEQQILSIAEQQDGKSLLLVSDGDVIAELEAIPGVSDATVTKHFPDSLTVTVTAQRPAAMLKVDGSSELTAVDSQGRVLNSVAAGTSTDGIPQITVDNVQDALKNKAVLNALTILNDLSETMRKSITTVTADTQDSVTTTLDSGITVVWGDAADMKLKAAIVDKIINDSSVIGDKTQVDVSAPSRPIIK